MVQNGEHKPTINGVIKGRPGKGKVLSLGQRARCYAGHRMTPENTFRYTAKATKQTPKPLEREWCKRCRADSRKRSQVKRLAAAKIAARQQAKAVREELAAAMPEDKPKPKPQPQPKVSGKAKPAPARSAKPAVAKGNGKAKSAKASTIVGTFADVKGAGKGNACGKCGETFPDPPTLTAHFGKAHKGARKAA